MNSKYFHTLAKIKNCRKKIACLRNQRGDWGTKDEELKVMMVDFFKGTSSTSHTEVSRVCSFHSSMGISLEDKQKLSLQVGEGDVWNALAQMPPMKSPGPDEIQDLFYKKYWKNIGTSVVALISKAFERGKIHQGINDSFLALILKLDPPVECKDFRPIGLCNTIYKLLTKTIANHIKPFLGDLIHPSQTSFVPGRIIQENVITAKEMAHFFKKMQLGKNMLWL